MTDINDFFVSCSKGYEDLLHHELLELGIDSAEQKYSGVSFSGSLKQAYSVCLWSRLASRVLLKLKSFTAETDDALYRGVQTINWPQHIDMQGTLAVSCVLNKSDITNSHYASLKTKDAIVDQFNELYESRPSVERDQPDVRVNVHIDHNLADISIDLSGGPLHKRGYRISNVQAPLKENLAAAILKRCGWPDSQSGGQRNLLDPMCGSATFLIEAAQMSLNIAPGLKRQYYGFNGWKGHQADIWKALLKDAKEQVKPLSSIEVKINGFDSSKDSIAAARQNIHSAGLQDVISVAQSDFSESCELIKNNADMWPAGLVVVNPPYGERLGEKRELAHLYSEMGECWRKHFPDWTIALFTANDELIKHIGLRAHRSNSFYNGAIKCKLHQYQIRPALSDEKRIERDEKYAENRSTILNRLKKNYKHIGRWARKNSIQAYRVYDVDIPEYAAAIDIYGDWVHVQEYQAPSKIELNKARQRFDLLVDVIPEVLNIDKDHIVVKTRRQQKGLSQYEKQANDRHEFFIEEQGFTFNINLTDFLDTGLFLDHRLTRQLVFDKIKSYSSPCNFLNLFSYTSSVSVYAAAAGANTTSVDMSNTYNKWSIRNFRNNGLFSDKHQFIKADCVKWMDKAAEQGGAYKLIFIDPPTFSNSKSMDDVFDVQKDHEALIDKAMELLEEGGEIIFSNNFKKFKLSKALAEKYNIVNVTPSTIPEDFKRHQKVHHCFIITKKPDIN
ncbi:MAG TPA: bifunctional 23S rRNA (guanine(2069)-N(7))-methyltransferase RlmK/23S rRNA (guanine(2445)-N(2))-methyltransferase RlmL [Gammaproteobacteria bacterium]|nr:bifunctional 23S rRNA (guanine(2069)-N(7))-methyltransferase RlmK/23S rRNA (guanine(2445)-N(2))-methyltransferase RlmL [Gammaproteobacteria bacterium]